MKKELFDELLESVREGGQILRGERQPARAFRLVEPDVRGVRESRHEAGAYISARLPRGAAVGVIQEPAPYCVPPLDFAHNRILLLPATLPSNLSAAELPQWLVFSADDDKVRGLIGMLGAFRRWVGRIP